MLRAILTLISLAVLVSAQPIPWYYVICAGSVPSNGNVLVYNSTQKCMEWKPTSGSGGISPVSSVFGRIGAITALSGDYTWAQINKTTSSLANITTRRYSDLQNIPATLLHSTGSYANPTWLTSLAYSKLTGTPDLSGYVSGRANLTTANYPVVVSAAGTVTQTSAVGTTYGGTGQSTTATSGRYLKGDGKVWGASNGSASGTGSCPGSQFVNALNSDAAPSCGTPVGITDNQKIGSFSAVFDGGGTQLPLNSVTYTRVPYACTITGYSVVADTGTVTIDVWKIATGTSLPTNANTITGGQEPALAVGNAVKSTTIDKWTTAVAADDIVGFSVDAVASATWVQVMVYCTKS